MEISQNFHIYNIWHVSCKDSQCKDLNSNRRDMLKMGENWRETFLQIDPPEIVKRPANQGVRVGGVATFFCSARGDPQPTINWRKDGKKSVG